jgi:hypothetical protein
MILHVVVAENALDWICRAKRSWVVGLYHVAGAMEALCVISHTHPLAGDWIVRTPGNKEMKRGGRWPRSTATTMESKPGATGGSNKFF